MSTLQKIYEKCDRKKKTKPQKAEEKHKERQLGKRMSTCVKYRGGDTWLTAVLQEDGARNIYLKNTVGVKKEQRLDFAPLSATALCVCTLTLNNPRPLGRLTNFSLFQKT